MQLASSMMRTMQKVEVVRRISAPIEKVWACYTDHRGWVRFLGAGKITLDPEGTPTADGVGCVRHIQVAGIEMVAEEVTVFEPPHRMKYRIVRGGGPFRDHDGEVLFEQEEGGTKVTWRCEFVSLIPGLGPLFALGVKRVFGLVLQGVERQLQQQRS